MNWYHKLPLNFLYIYIFFISKYIVLYNVQVKQFHLLGKCVSWWLYPTRSSVAVYCYTIPGCICILHWSKQGLCSRTGLFKRLIVCWAGFQVMWMVSIVVFIWFENICYCVQMNCELPIPHRLNSIFDIKTPCHEYAHGNMPNGNLEIVDHI